MDFKIGMLVENFRFVNNMFIFHISFSRIIRSHFEVRIWAILGFRIKVRLSVKIYGEVCISYVLKTTLPLKSKTEKCYFMYLKRHFISLFETFHGNGKGVIVENMIFQERKIRMFHVEVSIFDLPPLERVQKLVTSTRLCDQRVRKHIVTPGPF